MRLQLTKNKLLQLLITFVFLFTPIALVGLLFYHYQQKRFIADMFFLSLEEYIASTNKTCEIMVPLPDGYSLVYFSRRISDELLPKNWPDKTKTIVLDLADSDYNYGLVMLDQYNNLINHYLTRSHDLYSVRLDVHRLSKDGKKEIILPPCTVYVWKIKNGYCEVELDRKGLEYSTFVPVRNPVPGFDMNMFAIDFFERLDDYILSSRDMLEIKVPLPDGYSLVYFTKHGDVAMPREWPVETQIAFFNLCNSNWKHNYGLAILSPENYILDYYLTQSYDPAYLRTCIHRLLNDKTTEIRLPSNTISSWKITDGYCRIIINKKGEEDSYFVVASNK